MRPIKFKPAYLFALVIILISHNSFAQSFHKYEFAIESGMGLRTLRIDPAYPSLTPENGLGFTGGIAGQYNFTNTISLKLSAGYESKGTDFYRSDLQTNGAVNLDYISIPLLLKVKTGKKIKFYANAGPYLGILLSNITEIEAYSGNPETEYDNTDSTSGTDFGVSLGIGIEMPVGKSSAITIEIRDNFGLTNISKSKETNAPELKTQTLNLMLGYAFKFGKIYGRK